MPPNHPRETLLQHKLLKVISKTLDMKVLFTSSLQKSLEFRVEKLLCSWLAR